MLKLKHIATLSLLSFSTFIQAGSMGYELDSKTHWFAGLGGAYNAVQVKQNLYAIGVASYTGSISSSATMEGPSSPFYGTTNNFSPEIQAGGYKHFSDSNHLWGLKFSYQYLGTVITRDNFTALQEGAVNGKLSIGNLLLGSSQTKVDHELLLLPFIGHSFTQNSQFYLGVGPALFGTRSSLNSVVGFANLTNTVTDITGAPVNFSSPEWVWGGAAQIGYSYFVASDWFVDLSYTYAITGQYSANYSENFVNRVEAKNVTVSGTGYVNTNQSIMAQALTLSINKTF
jgi:hypothetical protein